MTAKAKQKYQQQPQQPNIAACGSLPSESYLQTP
jgi:hypothetical protein